MRKAFDYGTLVWLPVLAGASAPVSAAFAVVFLFVLEWAQRSIPGRTPEITDAVLALLMAFVLLRLRR
jgi:hypothetical protein